MVRHTSKILQQTLQDFKSVSDHFGTLSIKDLRVTIHVNLGSEATRRPFLKKNNSCFHGQGNFGHQNNKFNNKRLDI